MQHNTTIRMLTGLIPPMSGSIQLVGMPLAERELEIKRRIYPVPDESLLFDRLTGPRTAENHNGPWGRRSHFVVCLGARWQCRRQAWTPTPPEALQPAAHPNHLCTKSYNELRTHATLGMHGPDGRRAAAGGLLTRSGSSPQTLSAHRLREFARNLAIGPA